MWIFEVAMNTWMRGRSAWRTASHARSTSLKPVRESPAMIGPRTALAIASTESKSPSEAIGKPASITSTPRRASCSAISSFSATSSEIPGDCSPSRSVVSKILTVSMSLLPGLSGFRRNEKPSGPIGTEGRARAPMWARAYVRRRPSSAEGCVMSGVVSVYISTSVYQ